MCAAGLLRSAAARSRAARYGPWREPSDRHSVASPALAQLTTWQRRNRRRVRSRCVQYLAHLAREDCGRERLLQEVEARFEHPVMDDCVVGVPRDEKDLGFGAEFSKPPG